MINMAQEARVIQLQKDLIRLEMFDSLKALNWMLETMNAQNGYMRKDGSNYYYHLVDATQDLVNHGIRDQITITSCILHDAIEDIPEVTYETILNEYGYDVAFTVMGVTKKEGVDYKNGENLKAYLDYQLNFWRMILVKLADRKHNFSTMMDCSASHEARQVADTEKYFIPYAKQARRLYPEYSAYFHSFKTTIIPHLKRIKKAINTEAKLNEKIKEYELKLEQEKKRNRALEKKIRKYSGGNQ
jgi:guanosine-3',5'-bis(diphosphate) 3'-pyrophosphohydrolase